MKGFFIGGTSAESSYAASLEVALPEVQRQPAIRLIAGIFSRAGGSDGITRAKGTGLPKLTFTSCGWRNSMTIYQTSNYTSNKELSIITSNYYRRQVKRSPKHGALKA